MIGSVGRGSLGVGSVGMGSMERGSTEAVNKNLSKELLDLLNFRGS
jgi:hypothetical protein